MKIYNILILLITLSSCFGQTTLEKLRPQAYKKQEIDSLLVNYRKQVIDLTDYLPHGYSTNGDVDYTPYLQKGFNEHRIIQLPNFPILINDLGLQLKGNTVLIFNEKSQLILKPTTKDTYNILNIEQVENVKIFNANIKGDITNHLGTTGEWGMGIAIRSSNNVALYNPQIENCWGDGIYVGFVWDKENKILYPESKNIAIYNALTNNNGRNGLSIVAVDGLNVYNSLLANNRRTFPKAGIDIEPGPKLTKNVVLKNNVTYNNGARGIDIFLRTIAKNKINTTTAQIINHTDIQSPIGIRIAGYTGDKKYNQVSGKIDIINPVLKDNRLNQILIEPDQQYMPNILIESGDSNLIQSLNGNQLPRLEIKPDNIN